MTRAIAAAAVGAVAMWLYYTTLLPGQDLGDTASFQAAGSSPNLTPRQAYPLYFAIGRAFVVADRGAEPARALNLASAVCGSLAAAAATLVASELAGSAVAGVFTGLLFASSYTFWSQSIIAEVYALHLLLIAVSLAALLRWADRPASGRLIIFFAVYALSFGNHLSMILLAPAMSAFLMLSAPGGPRDILNVRVVTLASLVAAIGSLQYLGSLVALWHWPDPPADLAEALGAFWFDVTKADWRESMILGVPRSALGTRLAMYWFDLTQQFGVTGVVLALAGTVWLWHERPRHLVLVLGIFVMTAGFAFSYNVGDTHVFYLPSHLMISLLAGCGFRWIHDRARGRGRPRWLAASSVAGLLILYAAWRIADTWPAIDRSDDHRATEVLDRFTDGLDGQNALLVADLNWQLQNGLDYYAKHRKPDLAYVRAADSLLQFPFLVAANRAAGRDVVLSSSSAARVRAAFGPLYVIDREPRADDDSFSETIGSLPDRMPYVLCVLAPYREMPVNRESLRQAVWRLSGNAMDGPPAANFLVMVGRVGRVPLLVHSSMRPFRINASVGTLKLDIRMESWLPTDTIRRAGFGHVIVSGRHRLTMDRGISLLALHDDGAPAIIAYEAGLYAVQERYLLR